MSFQICIELLIVVVSFYILNGVFPNYLMQSSADADFEFSSIQCGQRQPSYSYEREADHKLAPSKQIDELNQLNVCAYYFCCSNENC